MVNSESLSDIFQTEHSENMILKVDQPNKSEGLSLIKCTKCCKNISYSVKICDKQEDKNCSNVHCVHSVKEGEIVKSEESSNITSNITKDDSDIASFELHLSPESEESAKEEMRGKLSTQDFDVLLGETHQSTFEEASISLDTPSSLSSRTNDVDLSSEREHDNSTDMFSEFQDPERSQELIRQPSVTNVLPSPVNSESNREHVPSEEGNREHVPSEEGNREQVEVWNTQELSEISENLKVRSKQVKRLIMAVIRKRQMADESLEAFKKRLKRL